MITLTRMMDCTTAVMKNQDQKKFITSTSKPKVSANKTIYRQLFFIVVASQQESWVKLTSVMANKAFKEPVFSVM